MNTRKPRGPYKRKKPIGPFSDDRGIKGLDGRTREAAVIRRTKEMLRKHVGNPSPMQDVLIESAAYLWLRVQLLMPRLLQDGAPEQDNKFLAWMNTLRRTLMALDLDLNDSDLPRLRHLDDAS